MAYSIIESLHVKVTGPVLWFGGGVRFAVTRLELAESAGIGIFQPHCCQWTRRLGLCFCSLRGCSWCTLYHYVRIRASGLE